MRWALYSLRVAPLSNGAIGRMGLEVGDELLGPVPGPRPGPVTRHHHADADGVVVGVEEAAARDATRAADRLDVDALVGPEPEAVFDDVRRQRQHLFDTEGVMGGVGRRRQPGFLGEKRVDAVAGDHDLGVDVALRPVGPDARDLPRRVAPQAGGRPSR